jgi:WD40 repeat protein
VALTTIVSRARKEQKKKRKERKKGIERSCDVLSFLFLFARTYLNALFRSLALCQTHYSRSSPHATTTITITITITITTTITTTTTTVIKIWDYQTKACIATLEGHTNNVSAVAFHPQLPVIISGSEDGTARIWHASTYRLEK